ncbi:iron permease, partial [Campylobacter coli]
MKFFKILFSLSMLFLANSVFARVDDYVAEANTIKNILEESIKSYEKGDNLKAKKLSEDAYFQHFENMEGSIGRNIGKKAITMERKFTNLRRLYKDKAPIEQIDALIESLYYDLDEVAPILQNGYRLQAEASDTNYDKAAAEKSSIQANAKREAEAEALIAQMMGIDKKDLAKTNSSSSTQNETINDSINNDLQAAAAMDARLQFILDNISTKFSQAANAFKEKNYQ